MAHDVAEEYAAQMIVKFDVDSVVAPVPMIATPDRTRSALPELSRSCSAATSGLRMTGVPDVPVGRTTANKVWLAALVGADERTPSPRADEKRTTGFPLR